MANVLLYVPTAVKNVLKSYVARNSEEEITPKFTRLLIVGMILLCAILIPFVVILVIPILYGEQFLASRILFVILVPGTIFWGVHTILLSDLEGRGLPKKVSQISVITGILTVLLDWALIPIWNAAGAALVSTVTYGFGLLLAMVMYKRIVRVKWANLLIPKLTDIYFFPRLLISWVAIAKGRSEKI
jgi:O-antigen/teichoic acid export membrane protein